jgi:hypothetical protein
MLGKTKWQLSLAAMGVVFGYGLGGAAIAKADEGTYKWCSEVNAKEQCVTCIQATDCGSQPYCCNPKADE